MKINTPQKISLIFLAVLLIFWFLLFINSITSGFYNYLYAFLLSLTPLIGGVIAMFSIKKWNGLKTSIGKAVFFIGLGIFLWGCGEIIWSYYNVFLGVPAPYPSFADIGFAPSIFFYGLGAFYLSQITGARFGLRARVEKIFVIVSLLIIATLSYYILIIVARGGILVSSGDSGLKTVLDIAYPLGDFIGLAISAIVSGLSFKYLLKRGKYTVDILAILLGLGVMFVADSAFSYTTTVGTYYNANWVDLLLSIGTFLLTFGVLGFYEIKESSATVSSEAL